MLQYVSEQERSVTENNQTTGEIIQTTMKELCCDPLSTVTLQTLFMASISKAGLRSLGLVLREDSSLLCGFDSK